MAISANEAQGCNPRLPRFPAARRHGPCIRFAEANHGLAEQAKRPFYVVEMISPNGGLVPSSGGVPLNTRVLSQMPPATVDTLLIAGAEAESLRAVIAEPTLRRWVPLCAEAAQRFGSVCAGTFVLAALGLVDGKRVATHWDACEQLATLYPSIFVHPESIYVVDGNVWTSAGVTTGIDMVLAMVGRDLGATITGQVAKRLVLYARRPGYQSQFSPLLRAQVSADSPFAELIGWMQANLNHPLDVPSLAVRAGLSERTFYRKFLAATGETPARYIESVRLDAARMLLAQRLSLAAIASLVGLASSARLTEAFQRRFGVSPKLFREMHASS